MSKDSCQFGVFDSRCGKLAFKQRMRPGGKEEWVVCDYHADFLDRLRETIEKNRELLNKLRDG